MERVTVLVTVTSPSGNVRAIGTAETGVFEWERTSSRWPYP